MRQAPGKKALLVVAGLLLAYLALGYWLDYYYVPRYYQEFHAARLRGVIRSRANAKLSVRLRLDNENRTYWFFPVDSRGYNQAADFVEAAAPGDSVYKAAGSDTLYLRVRGRTFTFTNEKQR